MYTGPMTGKPLDNRVKPPSEREEGELNEANAFWCVRHMRWECTIVYKQANKSRVHDHTHAPGNRCHWPALKYNEKCRKHVGMPVSEAHARGFARLSAFSSVAITNAGIEPPVTPAQAIMGMLSMSWMRVHYYAALLEAQIERDGDRSGVEEPDEPVGWLERQYERGEDARIQDEEDPRRPPQSGLIGHTFSGVKDIGIFATGEAVRALVVLEQQERDRCAKLAEMAHKMGISERQTRLAETQGAAFVGVVRRILDRLELTDQQRAMVSIVAPDELRKLKELDAVPLNGG